MPWINDSTKLSSCRQAMQSCITWPHLARIYSTVTCPSQLINKVMQADAVLAMTLRRLTSMETSKLQQEQQQLNERIAELQRLLADPRAVLQVVSDEASELADKFGDKRRTLVSPLFRCMCCPACAITGITCLQEQPSLQQKANLHYHQLHDPVNSMFAKSRDLERHRACMQLVALPHACMRQHVACRCGEMWMASWRLRTSFPMRRA